MTQFNESTKVSDSFAASLQHEEICVCDTRDRPRVHVQVPPRVQHVSYPDQRPSALLTRPWARPCTLHSLTHRAALTNQCQKKKKHPESLGCVLQPELIHCLKSFDINRTPAHAVIAKLLRGDKLATGFFFCFVFYIIKIAAFALRDKGLCGPACFGLSS